MKEKKARVEDAMHATRAAVDEGIVAGGGVALLRAAKALADHKLDGDEQSGLNIIARACEEPLRQIVLNAGMEGAVVVEHVRENKDPNFGYNAATGKYEDLIAAGVIDPTKRVRFQYLFYTFSAENPVGIATFQRGKSSVSPRGRSGALANSLGGIRPAARPQGTRLRALSPHGRASRPRCGYQDMCTRKWFWPKGYYASDVRGPPRHWLSNAAYTMSNAAPHLGETRVAAFRKEQQLLCDAIRAFARVVLRGFDLLTSLAAEDADEASHGVRLPAGNGHNLRQCYALGALHQRNHFGLLVGAVGFLAPLLAFARLLVAFLIAARFGLAVVSGASWVSIVLLLTPLLLDRVAIVTSITQVRRNCNQNLRRLDRRAAQSTGDQTNWRSGSFFMYPTRCLRTGRHPRTYPTESRSSFPVLSPRLSIFTPSRSSMVKYRFDIGVPAG
jgi:TCP-1/cpn60 chaperonin family